LCTRDIRIFADNKTKSYVKEQKWKRKIWIHLVQDSAVAEICDHGNEPSDSIKGGCSDQLSENQFFKKDSTPRSYVFYVKTASCTMDTGELSRE
jgi:hypothetical protein